MGFGETRIAPSGHIHRIKNLPSRNCFIRLGQMHFVMETHVSDSVSETASSTTGTTPISSNRKLSLNERWLERNLPFLRERKKRSDAQDLLIALAQKASRTEEESSQLDRLIKAERTAERARQARIDAEKMVGATKEAERKARTREMIEAAGLLILAGLVDGKTGKPLYEAPLLVGALQAMAEMLSDKERADDWAYLQEKGSSLLGGQAGKKAADAPSAPNTAPANGAAEKDPNDITAPNLPRADKADVQAASQPADGDIDLLALGPISPR